MKWYFLQAVMSRKGGLKENLQRSETVVGSF